MTDLEISTALALAIGWKRDQFVIDPETNEFYVLATLDCKKFDYRDWNVIGPIAERYDAFPFQTLTGWESWLTNSPILDSDTPQKAIALTVIGAKK